MPESLPTLLWVIDDDPDVAQHLGLRLRRIGADVRIRTIVDTAEARRALGADESPALVLLDHFLPDGDGLALVRGIRDAAPDAKIIMISSAPEEISLDGVERLDVLGKPIDAEYVRTVLTGLAEDDGADST